MQCVLTLLLVSLIGCQTVPISPRRAIHSPGKVVEDFLPTVYLNGSSYEMGFQHGTLLREEVRASTQNLMNFVDRGIGVPVLGKPLVRLILDRTWRRMRRYVPAAYLEELQGLSDGSGVPLAVLQRVHALPELLSTSCASFAAFGGATANGRLIQIRNLDWVIRSNVQRYAAVFVVRPEGKNPFVSIGWIGFIGVISGINQRGISVSEIGAKTTDASLKGVPMPFLLRRVLEEADGLEQAAGIIEKSPRTGGFNYLFADARKRQAVALETTHRVAAKFWDDQPVSNPYHLAVPEALMRSDWAADPTVRDLQLACKGDPKRPGLEAPTGSKAYDVRYRRAGELLLRFHGRMDPELAMVIAREIAPKSNVHSVIYAYPELWVANAKDQEPAATQTYHYLNLEDLFAAGQ